MSVVEIENIGPVSKLSIPIPEDGGVIVMTGRNGIGKSRALQAVEAAVTGRGKSIERSKVVELENECFERGERSVKKNNNCY